jgi:FkbM family methyltransferase
MTMIIILFAILTLIGESFVLCDKCLQTSLTAFDVARVTVRPSEMFACRGCANGGVEHLSCADAMTPPQAAGRVRQGYPSYHVACALRDRSAPHAKVAGPHRWSELPAEAQAGYVRDGVGRADAFYYADFTTPHSGDASRESSARLWNTTHVDSLVALAAARQPVGSYQPDGYRSFYAAFDAHPVRDKHALVIGSLVPWVEAILLAFGAASVTTIDYNPPLNTDSRIRVQSMREFNEQPQRFDVVVSYSSLEHSGLGRYGDPLCPDADLHAMNEVRSLLNADGLLYVAVPIGVDKLLFNAHRVYGRRRWPLFTRGFAELGWYGHDAASLDIDDGQLRQPIVVLRATHNASDGEDRLWRPVHVRPEHVLPDACVPSATQRSALANAAHRWLDQTALPNEYPLHFWEARDGAACRERGGRVVRYGGADDGSWPTCVTPSLLAAAARHQCVVYAFGVGYDYRWDAALAAAHAGCQVHSFDPTPSVIARMADAQLPPNMQFHAWGIAHQSSSATLQNYWTDYKPFDVKFYTLADIMRRLNHTHVDLIKVDIEGYEFDVFEQLTAPDVACEQLLFELHFRGPVAWLNVFAHVYAAGMVPFYVEPGRYHARPEDAAKRMCDKPGALQEFGFLRVLAPTLEVVAAPVELARTLVVEGSFGRRSNFLRTLLNALEIANDAQRHVLIGPWLTHYADTLEALDFHHLTLGGSSVRVAGDVPTPCTRLPLAWKDDTNRRALLVDALHSSDYAAHSCVAIDAQTLFYLFAPIEPQPHLALARLIRPSETMRAALRAISPSVDDIASSATLLQLRSALFDVNFDTINNDNNSNDNDKVPLVAVHIRDFEGECVERVAREHPMHSKQALCDKPTREGLERACVAAQRALQSSARCLAYVAWDGENRAAYDSTLAQIASLDSYERLVTRLDVVGGNVDAALQVEVDAFVLSHATALIGNGASTFTLLACAQRCFARCFLGDGAPFALNERAIVLGAAEALAEAAAGAGGGKKRLLADAAWLPTSIVGVCIDTFPPDSRVVSVGCTHELHTPLRLPPAATRLELAQLALLALVALLVLYLMRRCFCK